MARKVQVLLEDDVDGGPADESISFALDGRTYVIDLNVSNARALRDSFAPWIAAGRRETAAQPGPQRSQPRTARRETDTPRIRAWAREQGIEVSERGRISTELRARYDAAHS